MLMAQLPAIPASGSPISAESLASIEARVAAEVMAIEDVEQLQEWHAQAAAFAAYLQGRAMHGPMLGAQRRVEARIGQLLGEPVHTGKPLDVPYRGKELINDRQRVEFRVLARGLGQLADEEWR